MCGQWYFSHHISVVGNLFKVRFSNERIQKQSDQTMQLDPHHLILGHHKSANEKNKRMSNKQGVWHPSCSSLLHRVQGHPGAPRRGPSEEHRDGWRANPQVKLKMPTPKLIWTSIFSFAAWQMEYTGRKEQRIMNLLEKEINHRCIASKLQYTPHDNPYFYTVALKTQHRTQMMATYTSLSTHAILWINQTVRIYRVQKHGWMRCEVQITCRKCHHLAPLRSNKILKDRCAANDTSHTTSASWETYSKSALAMKESKNKVTKRCNWIPHHLILGHQTIINKWKE